MLARLLTLSNKETIPTYQRKITTLLNKTTLPLQPLLNRDVIKLIKIVSEYHEACVLKWKNNSFIQSLKNFKEKTRVRMENDMVDYSQLGAIQGELKKYRFLPNKSK
jgi:hypothetical protein